MFHNDRTIILIDSNGLDRMCAALDLHIDFTKFRSFFERRRFVSRIYYFAVVPEDDEEFPKRRYLDWLDYHGVTLKTATKRSRSNDNMDRYKSERRNALQLAVGAMECAGNAEEIVFVTLNADLIHAMGTIQAMGVRVSLLASRVAPTLFVPDTLIRQADEFIEIKNERHHFER